MDILFGIVITNMLGVIFEYLEDRVFLTYNDPRWSKVAEYLPIKIVKFLQENFSHDAWDWQDIKLNALGSTVILPLLHALKLVKSIDISRLKDDQHFYGAAILSTIVIAILTTF